MSSPETFTIRNGSEVAIIGMAGRFPGANTLEAFWQNLKNGVESISFFTDAELLAAGVDPALLQDPHFVKARAELEAPEGFDAAFFGFSPREAELTDPQHRLFLECAWSSLEHAGYDPATYPGAIGVFAGSSLSRYLLNVYLNPAYKETVDPYKLAIANDKDFLSTRVSYKLNLEGPSLTLQTACSTSLVSVHLAAQSLLNGECDMALAGGVSISASRKTGYRFVEGGISSPDGHCRAFDAAAQGTVGGEGVGIVVLKRLDEALADGDCIHAVIKGSAINNDGALKVSYTAPRIDSQAKVIQTAYAVAEVEPETVSYIESHGTATALGDPIEIAALTQAFRSQTQKKGFCAIGSVKTNVGHLDAAAGVTGLIKTVLALQHQQIPASLHYKTPNPQIDFANSPFYVNATLAEWTANGTPRRAGVSSFGIGGTNVHVVLEEAPQRDLDPFISPVQILRLSAKTPSALESATTNLAKYLRQHPQLNLADVAYTLHVGRRDFEHRRFVVCQSLAEAAMALESRDAQRIFTGFSDSGSQSIAFLFPGQGAQYPNMGRDLYEREPLFRRQIDDCAERLQPHLDLDLRTILYPAAADLEAATQQLTQTAIAQPALFTIEYALAQLWIAWGVQPTAMIGHSIGEYVAACLAGVFSLEDALALVAERGRLMQQLPPGAMLSVRCSESDLQNLLPERLGTELCLAGSNSPSVCAVSGTVEAIATLQQDLVAKEIGCRRLQTSHAFHSPLVEQILPTFAQILQGISLHAPQRPFLSNLTGTWITDDEATNPQYWCSHLRHTVRFSAGMTALLNTCSVFLEVGPGRTLSTFTHQHSVSPQQLVVTSLRHPQEECSDDSFLLNTVGRLWLKGIDIKPGVFYLNPQQRVPLPTYPFEHQRYWIDSLPVVTEESLQPKTDIWADMMAAGHRAAQSQVLILDEPTHQIQRQTLDRLCVAYMNLALRQLGAFAHPDERYSIATVLTQFQIIPRYQQLLQRWIAVLVEQGNLQYQEEQIFDLQPLSPEQMEQICIEIKSQGANTLHNIDLIQYCGENLAAVLTGNQEPLVLYTTALEHRSASTPPPEIPLNKCLKAIAQSLITSLTQSLAPDTQLRILEIGGGNGLVTAALLPNLPPDRTHYTFTDVGGWFLEKARQKFSSHSFVDYRFLNIERTLAEQGYLPHSLDVVVAVNVLHVTQNIEATLQQVRTLLAPGGILLLWEIIAPQFDFEITDSLLMHPVAEAGRNQGNPFLSKNQWQTALLQQGFTSVEAFSETEPFGELILVARTDSSHRAPAAFTASTRQKLAPTPLEKKPNLCDWFYLPSWKRSQSPSFTTVKLDSQAGCWLVFADECGLGAALVQRLVQHHQDVVVVNVGERFSRNLDADYPIYDLRPTERQDYDALLQALRALHKTPKKIVHAWSVTSEPLRPSPPAPLPERERGASVLNATPVPLLPKGEKGLGDEGNLGYSHNHNTSAQIEALGLMSLTFLAQALGEVYPHESIAVGAIANQMQAVTGTETLCPEKALLLGPCRVMPLEYPTITCASIDIVLPANQPEMLQTLSDQVLAELMTPMPDAVVAYRGHHRWVPHFEPLQLEMEPSPRLREKGVYLITGGLGGIGLALAQHLAQSVQATLILLGRSEFPNRQDWDTWLAIHPPDDPTSQKIQRLRSLEAVQATVRVIQADVANFEQMQGAIAQIQQEFGAIHGVIHAAAVTGGGMMQLATQEAIARSLAPKVQGTRILEALLHDKNLDCFILCSSLSAFQGSPGMMDYVAENAFLDAFSQSRGVHSLLPIQSLNWDRWTGVGMAQSVESRHQDLTGEALTGGLSCSEGVEVFQRILSAAPVPQVIISTQDSSTLLQRAKVQKSLAEVLAKLSYSRPTHARPSLGKALVAPRNAVEETLAQIWQQLLGIEKVGIHDNFFELGGDSLFATQLVAQLCKTFQIELPYRQFFNAPTIAELAECITQDTSLSRKAGAVQPLIQPRPQDLTFLELSFAQQRLWFMDQLQPRESSHTIAQAVRLIGALQVTALEQSFQEIVNRHEALRTNFTQQNGRAMQMIHPHLALEMTQIDLRDRLLEEREKTVQDWASAEAHRTFDLSRGPLLNVTLLCLGETEHVLLLSMHHIIADGWSISILLQELTALYTAFAQGDASPLPHLPIQYADFALWQRDWLQGERLENQLSYWTQQLKDLPVLALPSTAPETAVCPPVLTPTRNGSRQYHLFPKVLVETLKGIHQREGVTLFMILTAAFKLWLHHYTGQSDIVVGTDIANRNQAGTENLIGFFVNQLVLRTRMGDNPTFQTVLEQVRETTLDAYAHQDLPFDKLVEALNPVRDGQQTPLFQVKIVLETPQNQPFTLPGLTLQPLTVDRNTVQFDLLLELNETERGLHSIWEYNIDRFDRNTITQMMVQFDQLLHHIAQHPNATLSNLTSTLAEAEMKQQMAQVQTYETTIARQLATLKRDRRSTPERSSP
jgi:acyl transferase domain-containing protein/non-ribosomal peptide synthetase component F